MTVGVPFQTRARTIDHLGREQIADVPTAVSELWKNAYDAYARHVSLHIYGQFKSPLAAVFDDGVGMTPEQFIETWLVVGTESKVVTEVPAALRKGLSPRPKQGQKGIGRLSVAALGATVLVVSKQETSPFVVSLIDWRLFENPFLYLSDIRIPVLKCARIEEIAELLPDLKGTLSENVPVPSLAIAASEGVVEGKQADPEHAARRERVARAWKDFDELSQSELAPGFTSEILRNSIGSNIDYTACLKDWRVSSDSTSGTALVMSEINSALRAWTVEGASAAREDAASIRDSLRRTLTGFSDPYSPNADTSMEYEVVNHTSKDSETIVHREEGYGIDFLWKLDQCIEGEVDEHGVFKGNVRAFGKNIGVVEILPSVPPPVANRDRVGPFAIAIGAFEGEVVNSTLDPDVHAAVMRWAETHSGLAIYRDGLRVMPYGRPENDFFKIEERRQKHAGREFWASRRLFGRIAISRRNNPNLRDKAGREGLIDNTASREIQLLVIDLLKSAARRYFGSDAPLRKELLPAIEAENNAAALKAKAARDSQANNFRARVREQSNSLVDAERKIIALRETMEDAERRGDERRLMALGADVDGLIGLKNDLRLPPRPKNLGSFEDKYRQYRDRYASLASEIDAVRDRWVAHSDKLKSESPGDVARSHLGRVQQSVTAQIRRWSHTASTVLGGEMSRLEQRSDQDQKEFYKGAAPLLGELESGRMSLATVLKEMDGLRDSLLVRFAEFYEPYIRAITALSRDIDLDTAFSYAGERQATLERRLEQIQGLAQIGISVEIISHELASIQRRLSSSLSKLEREYPGREPVQDAKMAATELVERLRFLSQMQVAGGDIRQKITGEQIGSYIIEFFHGLLAERGVTLNTTASFKACAFQEFPSRMFPVFINIISNSLYWLGNSNDKQILLDAGEGALTISDSGPGVDPDDVPNLFDLFFTRRARGRGVGLFLCRQTLAAGGHTIEYVTVERQKKLPGANFIIQLRNGFDG